MTDIMNAITRLGGRRDTDGSPTDKQNEPNFADNVRELLAVVTQETRFVLIQNILAHPKKAPSLKELDFVNPSKSESTIRNHLEKLEGSGVIKEIELPKDARSRDLPWKFYTLTAEAREFLEEHDLVRAEDTLEEMHAMLERTEEIEKYENAPRPDGFDSGERTKAAP